jgi:hypothetical protein
MNRRPLTLIALCCTIALTVVRAADTPPSETSIKQLLEAGQVHKLIDETITQLDSYMKQSMQQVTQGQRITPEIQKDIDRRQTEMMGMIKEVLDWNKLEPVYVRVYQKTFTQGEVDGLTAFYKTPTGPGSLDEDAGSDAEHAERNATDDTADDATGSAHAAGGCSRDPGSKEEERRLAGQQSNHRDPAPKPRNFLRKSSARRRSGW